VATSETSARVGIGLSIIDSSIWVATITGLAAARHLRTSRFWIGGTFCTGSSTPRSPRATMIPSEGEDFVEGLDGGGFLDLRQDRGAPLGERARLFHVGGALHEGQRQPVDAQARRRIPDPCGPCPTARQAAAPRRARSRPCGSRSAARDHGAIGEIGAAGSRPSGGSCRH
jgi:hypothetical protein